MEFSKQLVFVRAKLKLSQSNLADDLGVSLVTINRWENKISVPNKVAKVRFAEFCKDSGIELEVEYD